MKVHCFICCKASWEVRGKFNRLHIPYKHQSSAGPHISIIHPFTWEGVGKFNQLTAEICEPIVNHVHEMASQISPFEARVFAVEPRPSANNQKHGVCWALSPHPALEMIRQGCLNFFEQRAMEVCHFPYHVTLAKGLTESEAAVSLATAKQTLAPFDYPITAVDVCYRETRETPWLLACSATLRGSPA